jgi:hypothetical protein
MGGEVRVPGGRRVCGGAGDGMHGARLKAAGGGQGTRGAHRIGKEHVLHVRDLGGVEAQRLIERRCALPSRQEGVRCGPRCGPGGGGAWSGGVASGMHGGKVRLKAWGGRARAERTANMAYMVMTLDVSKFSGWLNDVALCRIEGTAYARFRAGRRKGLGWWRHRSGMHMHGKRARLKAGAPGHVRSARRT